MLIFPIAVAVAASTAAAYPEGFTAQCTDAKETSVWLGAGDVSRVTIHRFPGPHSSVPSGPIAIPGYVPTRGGKVTLSYRNGRFSVELLGPDFDMVQADGSEFDLKILKAVPGDLVLSVQTSTWGASLTVYHLRYKGDTGALSIARTSYYGHGDDETSLIAMNCKIGGQSLQWH
jgi:hypothetical protein